MKTRQRIPDDLAQRAPGPELAATLAEIELSRLVGFDAVEVLRAQYRQLAHEQARFLALMAEVGLCDDEDTLSRASEPGEFACEEARTALVLTRRSAEDQFWFGHDLLSRLPTVHAAMAAGNCDRSRAWIFCEWTKDLAPEQARAIVDRLLPRVVSGELTTGQLIEQIKRLAIAVDPEWARRRYEQALAECKVVGTRNPDGTANLAGYNLPVDRVAAAAAHIDRLAKAAKRAGSGRRLDHLRAELFLGMTDGAYTGLDDDAIVALLLATNDDSAESVHTDGESVDTTESAARDNPAGAEPAHGAGSAGDDEPNDAPAAEPDANGPGPADRVGAEEAATQDEPPVTALPGRGCGGIELRVRISTLLGHNNYPGELAGWGPVHAELARDLAAALGRGEWRWVVTDEWGVLLDCGITRDRPTGTLRTGPRTRDVVELQIPKALLDKLDPAELGAWAPMIADLARQHADQQAPQDRFMHDAHRRHPSAAQRRWLQMRDQYCLGRGCRAPARSNQQDHTIDHGLGGPTLEWNLGGLCGLDHALKTSGGWTLTQLAPGHFRWKTRLGYTYQVPPRRIIEPLPDPIPRDFDDAYPILTTPEEDWEQDKILEDPPPLKPEPPPRPRYDPEADPPF